LSEIQKKQWSFLLKVDGLTMEEVGWHYGAILQSVEVIISACKEKFENFIEKFEGKMKSNSSIEQMEKHYN